MLVKTFKTENLNPSFMENIFAFKKNTMLRTRLILQLAIRLHSQVTYEDESLTELVSNILWNSMPEQIKLENS